MPRIGSIKLYSILKLDLKILGVKIGRDKFHKILKEQRLLVPRKKKFIRTSLILLILNLLDRHFI